MSKVSTKPLITVKGKLSSLNLEAMELIASLGGEYTPMIPTPPELQGEEDSTYIIIPDKEGNFGYMEVTGAAVVGEFEMYL